MGGHDADRGQEYKRIRHLVYNRLSNFELGVTSTIFQGMRTIIPRTLQILKHAVPGGIFVYLLIDWADKENFRFHRKNPKEFENDV